MKPQWLAWARDLESVPQNGRHYAKDLYDVQRYETVRRIAAEILATKFDAPATDIERLLSLERGHDRGLGQKREHLHPSPATEADERIHLVDLPDPLGPLRAEQPLVDKKFQDLPGEDLGQAERISIVRLGVP